jgi:hypothetical protein
MPTSKMDAFPLFLLPSDGRAVFYDHCDKSTLGQLAQTCQQANVEINPVADEVEGRRYSPFDTHRKRDFPGIAVPEGMKSRSAKDVYQIAKIISNAHDRIEVSKELADAYRKDASVAMQDSRDHDERTSASRAERADKKGKRISNALKGVYESDAQCIDDEVNNLLTILLAEWLAS